MHSMLRSLPALAITGFLNVMTALPAWAQNTPAGLWTSFDQESKKPAAVIRVTESAGIFTGVIEQLLDPATVDARCGKCTDERKDKPVLGLTVLSQVSQSKDDPSSWSGGTVLEVKTGKVYKVQLRLSEGGQTLDVRGYVGAPMFGRTQNWRRIQQESSPPKGTP